MHDRKKIGEILAELQVLTPAEVERILDALRRRGDHAKFGRVAREMGYLREEHILAALAVQLQMFPGIQHLSLHRLLDRLQDSSAVPKPLPLSKGRRPVLKTKR